ncbi:hypothetical protein [Haliovirga abyssi]|uniref:Uncharacterized protein n=1 Tax=Haliovirga abyssi TaxID=2996794 RepID=A0AAU9DME7_9FUSO|nr:hypothetical protein [Haliovirga abyssi]BDU49453.1 hypothetical protein HLVA_00220 [Haliovirga abyssi]
MKLKKVTEEMFLEEEFDLEGYNYGVDGDDGIDGDGETDSGSTSTGIDGDGETDSGIISIGIDGDDGIDGDQ